MSQCRYSRSEILKLSNPSIHRTSHKEGEEGIPRQLTFSNKKTIRRKKMVINVNNESIKIFE